jgi:hypothetical protein
MDMLTNPIFYLGMVLGAFAWVVLIHWHDMMASRKSDESGLYLLRIAILVVALLVLGLLKKGLTHATLKRVIELVPGHKLRKRLGKLLADEAQHAAALRNAGRPRAAKWIETCTWGLAAWYIAASPITALWSLLLDQSGAAK